jgi:adenylyltransferase/sulfurtransferase
VHELKGKLDANEEVLLLDVREPNEHKIARIEGAKLIPLREFPSRMAEFEKDAEIVIHCHSGMRSAQAVQLMQEAGFERVFNLAGGIDAWSQEIDESVPRY